MSALADGEGGAAAVDRACRGWRDDASARQKWHAYHLIGDVLRSDELAAPRGRDAAFLGALRQRLAAEPVVLAPAPAVRRRQPWLVPAAMAAGFAAVAGVLVLARTGPAAGLAPAAEVAAASSPATLLGATAAAPMFRVGTGSATGRGARATLVNDGGLLRDARLDEFLRAHQAVGTGMTMAVPGGTLRRVDLLTPADSGR
ncbi:MAG: sigma-E factor negative regulatory protein [Burkholderiales bacterium]|nr:sigma-E factor negative regulatory protein [Burkholderiales bacterium]